MPSADSAPATVLRTASCLEQKLPEILRYIADVGERSRQSASSNVFHAGDGNLHPILLFDERDAQQVHRVMLASDEILERLH